MKTNLDKLFKADKKSETEGVWFAISDTTEFRLRRFSDQNPDVKKVTAKYYKPYARQMDLGTLPPEKEREIFTKIFVGVCLLDWKGVEIDGQEKKMDKDLAVEFFMELPELMTTLFEYAKDFSNFKEEFEGDQSPEEATEALGNS